MAHEEASPWYVCGPQLRDYGSDLLMARYPKKGYASIKRVRDIPNGYEAVVEFEDGSTCIEVMMKRDLEEFDYDYERGDRYGA